MEKFFEAGHADAGAARRRPARRRRRGEDSSRCSARLRLLNVGVQPLLDAIVAYVPSPAERAVHGRGCQDRRGGRAARPPTPRPMSAFVWKTIADPFAGRITMFRVVSGALKADSTVHNKTRDTHRASRPPACCSRARRRRNVPELKAGDLGAGRQAKDTLTNETPGQKRPPLMLLPR